VVMAFRLCFGRDPDGDELASSLRFLAAANDTVAPADEASAPADDAVAPADEAGAANGARGWSTMERFCQALLCTAEFRNLD
jgi:cytochrome c5